MGIPGLINAIGSGERISLSRLAITHLERTSRPIRIAVDVSIWLFQVQAARGGTNPELRTLFYRLLKLLALPIHPLFVYDGKEKPPFKRGKASGVSYGSLPIIRLSKLLVDLFKFPRHDAPGEAEAECARLQTAGIVDAVMSNDVDALMFGSTLTVMNFSKESGSGTTAATHVTCYHMDNQNSASSLALDRAGMILFAMLSGGDYLPSGVPKCGSKLAAEIAKAGFGADLLEVIDSDGADLEPGLAEWRERLQYELEENESGYFQKRHKAVRIPETFPDKTILSCYAKPVVSTEQDLDILRHRLVNAWDQDIDVVKLRRFAANTFEWNYRSGARKMIRLLAEPLVTYRLRLQKSPSAFADDEPRLSNSDAPMLQKVYKSRTSFSTDGLTELQLDYIPIDVVGLDLLAEEPNPPLHSQETTVSDEEEEEVLEETVPQSPAKKRVSKRYDPISSQKIWVFESLALIGIPDVVERWKKDVSEKSAPKKSTSRKTGPRKKGPIDPGMKRGSILKYGTLTKERSEISQFHKSQLFEAAISMTPTEDSPSMFVHRGSPTTPGRSFGKDASSQYMSTFGRDVEFDDLADRFSSSCSVSSDIPIKRNPMVTRSGVSGGQRVVCSGDAGAEILDISCPELSLGSSSPAALSRIRMSFSNASYEDVPLADTATSSSRDASRRLLLKSDRQPPKHRGSCELLELEQAVSPIDLDAGSPRKSAKSRSQPDVCPQRAPRRQKAKKTNPILEYVDDQTSSPPTIPEAVSPSRIQDLLEKKALDMPSLRKQLKDSPQNWGDYKHDMPSKPDAKKPVKLSDTESAVEEGSHVESIVAYDGYWTVDTGPESELVSDASSARSESKKSGRKQQFKRVRVLDLR
ncbi:crossover junction endodeoxyribonuclease [Aspergillus tanneri]|uniref:XPG-I domain-containing protein n=1 Tax=Aspergillus tanneri TaxID=1220188 RepID=A0A5M9MPH6_9EURO|nr:uncharacterized protein ATNIH1004_007859 [Aspergillus tanneri]KAA8646429.1 hypothetical protein ATNIH1004_007859 [Aspergillus tanneri]